MVWGGGGDRRVIQTERRSLSNKVVGGVRSMRCSARGEQKRRRHGRRTLRAPTKGVGRQLLTDSSSSALAFSSSMSSSPTMLTPTTSRRRRGTCRRARVPRHPSPIGGGAHLGDEHIGRPRRNTSPSRSRHGSALRRACRAWEDVAAIARKPVLLLGRGSSITGLNQRSCPRARADVRATAESCSRENGRGGSSMSRGAYDSDQATYAPEAGSSSSSLRLR